MQKKTNLVVALAAACAIFAGGTATDSSAATVPVSPAPLMIPADVGLTVGNSGGAAPLLSLIFHTDSVGWTS